MKPVQVFVLRTAALVVGSAIIGASIATNPATAQDVNSMLGAIGLTTCSQSTPCKKYKNNGSGAGLEGVGGNGSGLIAQSTNGSATFSTSTNADGVQAYSSNNDGTNSGTNNDSSISPGRSGIWGHDDSTDGGGNNVGVAGSSTYGVGVSGSSTNNSGVQGSSTNWIGVAGSSSTYIGVYGNSGYRGADITGGFIGVIGRAPAGTGDYPLMLTDSSGNTLDYTDGDGDMYVHGTYNNFARVRNGNTVVSYGAMSASPSIEDTGSGQLVNGIAIVNLDMTFAQAIDPHQMYHVMLTPDGDTRGLFVASKSPNGFVVREVQGGHGSLSFDYHIYAVTLGQANERMFMMTPAQTTSFMPKAAIVAKHPSKLR
jgi:hypothetical protein